MYHPENYLIAKMIFLRGLGVIYFFAFFPFLFQIKGLIGEKGILPIRDHFSFLKKHYGNKRFLKVPSLFWINSSDAALLSVVVTGIICSLLLMFGFYPSLMLAFLYILYLSIIYGGQDFLSFGWELFLMEITINAFFLSLTSIPNVFMWISINFLLFRFHLQAGAVKLQSRDPHWRDLTALKYHYVTQPIPNRAAWYVHKLPMWFHKASCLFMFFVELTLPFALFGNEELRLMAFAGFFSLQLFIWLTGNFSYLNYMTALFSLLAVSDTYLIHFFDMPYVSSDNEFLVLFVSLVGLVLFTLQLVMLWNHFIPNSLFSKTLKYIQPFFPVNRYGLFAVMTTKRYEVVIVGSHDGKTWKEYLFKHKVTEIAKRPKRVAPYQPRLDWQIWFTPMRRFGEEAWFESFMIKLLQNEKSVLDLMRYHPFLESPPKFIQALYYEYTYSDFATKKETGNWWKRTYIGPYCQALKLKNG